MADTYREREPSAALAGAVRTIWVQRVGDEPAVHRHLPTGGVELHAAVGGAARLLGPLTGYRLEVIPPRTTIVGVRFRPGGAPPLPMPLEELVDRSVPLEEVWGGLAERLLEDVAGAGTAERATGVLEEFLLQRFRVGRVADPLLRAAVEALMPWRPVEVATVAADVGLSESQLRRRSLSAVGLSPKVLQRTLRFQGFLALAQAGAVPSGRVGADGIAGLAVDAGYADQAHLGRECLRLTGQTPRELLHGDVGRCACGHDHSASYRPFLAGRFRSVRAASA
ncbi:AraC family transcriptional regulator [Microbacterium sp. Au-Mic1]|uniref:helix-turn-helix domain-containing protein n=1 Tax=Microbacterium sp. Au-Mic1 TaxID=2906457 RepID=UPI001E5D98FF|nr:AraC family transcriptional regulator [Microbacterium sp. Au-Mic1]MCE4027267.1 AraC family transcriptional regulator [Microbacterium sp. Au-Mic1]